MHIFNLFKKSRDAYTFNDTSVKTETLYTNKNVMETIDGVILPAQWNDLNHEDLKKQARIAVKELSISSNQDFKAKQLGFVDAKHLIKICFDYILK